MIELPDFSDINVLVVGDVMLDSYWHGGTNRISPEAPGPGGTSNRGRGSSGVVAGNVALNIASLNGKANLLGLTGDDDMANTLEQQLQGEGVECGFTRLDGLPTITKLRVISRHQQLIRLDFEDGFLDLIQRNFSPASIRNWKIVI